MNIFIMQLHDKIWVFVTFFLESSCKFIFLPDYKHLSH